MDHDAATSHPGSLGGEVGVIPRALVVIDHDARIIFPDLDAEPIRLPGAEQGTVNGSEQETIISGIVDLPPAFALGAGTSDCQPLIGGAFEFKMQFALLELELRVAGGNVSTLLIPGDESKRRLPGDSLPFGEVP